MKSNLKHTIILLSTLLITSMSFAAARVVLRSDYGKGSNKFEKIVAPVADRMDGIGHILSGKPMGGAYDLIYQQTLDRSFAQVFRCPSVRECKENTDCIKAEKYWQCDQIYEGSQENLCDRYKTVDRVHTFANWIGSEVVTTVIFNQIDFLNKGIFMVASTVDEAAGDYEFAKDLIEASCHANGFGDALRKANDSGLVLIQEKNKEEVNHDLNIFYDPRPPESQSPLQPSTTARYSNYDYLLKPVTLDPTRIQSGMMDVQER